MFNSFFNSGGPKKLAAHKAFIKNRNVRWWDLDEFGKCEHLKNKNDGSLKLFKHKEIPLIQISF